MARRTGNNYSGARWAFSQKPVRRPIVPLIHDTRACPDCGRPQHYTGTEYGWAHDALVDTWHCADPQHYRPPQRCLNCGARGGEPCEDWCAYKPAGRTMP